MQLAAVEFRNVSKSFGTNAANAEVSFSVTKGHIHGIVGENGAGKSTAMKILFGLYTADSGDIFIHGEKKNFQSPLQAMAAKVGMVHQHFMLAEALSVLDNIILFTKGSVFGKLPRPKIKAQLEKLCQQFGFQLNLEARVSELSVSEHQRLEILKVLSQDSEIIILDEPTAVLTPQEIQDLFKNLRKLKEEGKTILVITHKLKEVMELTDAVTVFRSGRVIGTVETNKTNIVELAQMMMGRQLKKPTDLSAVSAEAPTLLSFENLSARFHEQMLQDINLQIKAGEIVGVAGVEGNGQDALIRALLEPESIKITSGLVQHGGTLASFPEDRLRVGVLASRPAYENFLLGQQHRSDFTKGFFLDLAELKRQTEASMHEFDVRPRDLNLQLESFSGGNQQKLVVARALSQKPQVLVAAQPTRGVDIGAIEFIHEKLRQAQREGTAVLLISSELEELTALSNRIVVLYKGQIIKTFQRHEFQENALGCAMGGVI